MASVARSSRRGLHHIMKTLFDSHVSTMKNNDVVVGPAVTSAHRAYVGRTHGREMSPVANCCDPISLHVEVLLDPLREPIVDYHDRIGGSKQPTLNPPGNARRESTALAGLRHAKGIEVLHPDNDRHSMPSHNHAERHHGAGEQSGRNDDHKRR